MSPSAHEYKRGILSKQFQKLWRRVFNFHEKGLPADEIVEKIKFLDENHLLGNEIALVYSLIDFSPLYISKNAESPVSYTIEELMNWKASLIFKLLSVSHISFMFHLVKWQKSFEEIERRKGQKQGKLEIYFCGVQSKLTKGKSTTFFNRYSLERGENCSIPETTVCYLSDVTHLFRGDFYWVLFKSKGGKEEFTRLYSSKTGSKVSKSLLTGREKEILEQISKGMSNKETGTLLNISPGTVEKHRKNMLEKSGARDTTSLIHLCKMCRILE